MAVYVRAFLPLAFLTFSDLLIVTLTRLRVCVSFLKVQDASPFAPFALPLALSLGRCTLQNLDEADAPLLRGRRGSFAI
jgi:hypothetical protein